MFRKQALDHLSSPEQLDQLLQVVSRRSWLPLLVLSGGMLVAMAWAIFGKIPVTVEGNGILIHPGTVKFIQSPSFGRVSTVLVEVGDDVVVGQLLAEIIQPQLQEKIKQEEARLKDLETRHERLMDLRIDRVQQEKNSIAQKRERIEKRISTIGIAAHDQKMKSDEYFNKQKGGLEQLNVKTKELGEERDRRLTDIYVLLNDQLISKERALLAKQNALDSNVKLADIELRLNAIGLNRLEATALYEERRDRIKGLQGELEDLLALELKLKLDFDEKKNEGQLRINESKATIELYETELELKSELKSIHSGEILEISIYAGQIVSEGQQLGAIDVSHSEDELIAVAFFEVRHGKIIEKKHPADVSPVTVLRERYGSMIGEVTDVTILPATAAAATNLIGNAEKARLMTQGGDKIQIKVKLRLCDTDTGFCWTSVDGPPDVSISAHTTVKVRVIIEERAPISFLLPILKELSGQ